MKKKIMILTSYLTGAGHKSITEALLEQLQSFDVEVEVVECFELGGKAQKTVGELYGTVTRKAKSLWGLIFEMQSLAPGILNQVTQQRIEKAFRERLKAFKPDLILSVHPMFVGSIINILEKDKQKIPFVTLLADLVSIADLWIDGRSTYTLCPTQESYELLRDTYKIDPARLKRCGFPIRARFYQPELEDPNRKFMPGDKLKVLLMSGGEGSGNLRKSAEMILSHFEGSQVTVIAGRNRKIQDALNSGLSSKFGSRIKVVGFVDNVQDYMREADIAVVRGSPNTLLEGVMCNTPLLIVGALPGQEEENPNYVIRHELGAVCQGNKNMIEIIERLLAYSAAQLNAIREAQREFRDPNAAKDIVSFIMDLA